jgi:hypothetical protein
VERSATATADGFDDAVSGWLFIVVLLFICPRLGMMFVAGICGNSRRQLALEARMDTCFDQ